MLEIINKKTLGINGLGRIGKLTLWYHLSKKYFDGIVINVGREVGKKFEDLIHMISSDTTYGRLDNFLYGHSGKKAEIKIIDRNSGLISIDDFSVKFLYTDRNPKDIKWREEGVKVVIDCTGKFLDPTLSANDPKGSLTGHIEAGALKVIASAPFKIKNLALENPDEYPTLIYGINHNSFDAGKHPIISAASCTTTGLAYMVKPLLEDEETKRVLTASMTTVHAATNTQSVLDSVPTTGTSDLRKNRSVLNNIILSSTGAAKTLERVIPQAANFGFMADSIRIPTPSVSLISLNITFSSRLNENGMPYINAQYLKEIYKTAASGSQKNLLYFSDIQNVSTDLMGLNAAVVIEGNELHTRTGFLQLHPDTLLQAGIHETTEVNLPVTHAKILAWYDI